MLVTRRQSAIMDAQLQQLLQMVQGMKTEMREMKTGQEETKNGQEQSKTRQTRRNEKRN